MMMFTFRITVFFLVVSVFGCALMSKSPMSDCKALCQGEKVDSYKDETAECKCNLHKEASTGAVK